MTRTLTPRSPGDPHGLSHHRHTTHAAKAGARLVLFNLFVWPKRTTCLVDFFFLFSFPFHIFSLLLLIWKGRALHRVWDESSLLCMSYSEQRKMGVGVGVVGGSRTGGGEGKAPRKEIACYLPANRQLPRLQARGLVLAGVFDLDASHIGIHGS